MCNSWHSPNVSKNLSLTIDYCIFLPWWSLKRRDLASIHSQWQITYRQTNRPTIVTHTAMSPAWPKQMKNVNGAQWNVNSIYERRLFCVLPWHTQKPCGYCWTTGGSSACSPEGNHEVHSPRQKWQIHMCLGFSKSPWLDQGNPNSLCLLALVHASFI